MVAASLPWYWWAFGLFGAVFFWRDGLRHDGRRLASWAFASIYTAGLVVAVLASLAR